jgi:hypothetical protein
MISIQFFIIYESSQQSTVNDIKNTLSPINPNALAENVIGFRKVFRDALNPRLGIDLMYENNDGTYFRGRKFAFPSVSGYVFV